MSGYVQSGPLQHAPSHVPIYIVGQALLDMTFTDDPSLAPSAWRHRPHQLQRPAGAVTHGSFESLTAALCRLKFDSDGRPVLHTQDCIPDEVQPAAGKAPLHALVMPQHQQLLVGMMSGPHHPQLASSFHAANSRENAYVADCTNSFSATHAAGNAGPDAHGSAEATATDGPHGIDKDADLTASLSKDGGAVVLQNPDGSTALVLLTSDGVTRTRQQQAVLRQQYGPCTDLSTYEVCITPP